MSTPIQPFSEQSNIAVVFIANTAFVPHLAALLHSMVEHANTNNHYDCIVFHDGIDQQLQRQLASEFARFLHVSIRFFDVSELMNPYKSLYVRGHFNIVTYFRLLVQDVLVAYNKVLYLDADTITLADVAELYHTPLDGYLLAACRDADTAGLYNGYSYSGEHSPAKKQYMDTVLKIKEPYDYFQAGVVVFNLEEMRSQLKVTEMLDFAASRPWELLDQDVLNFFAQGKVRFVDMAWNVLIDWKGIRHLGIIALAPPELRQNYEDARLYPKIVHYAGPQKPWHDPTCDFAGEYWRFMRRSNFYELALAQTIDWRAKELLASKMPALTGQVTQNNPSLVRRAYGRFFPPGTQRNRVLRRIRGKKPETP